MASFVRMPFMLMFHQSKCISAIKRTLFYYFHVLGSKYLPSIIDLYTLVLIWNSKLKTRINSKRKRSSLSEQTFNSVVPIDLSVWDIDWKNITWHLRNTRWPSKRMKLEQITN